MIGTDAVTGSRLDGPAHLAQRIRDILTTRIGTRVMRREYGSRVPELVDRPVNTGWLVDLTSASAEALDKWETEFRLTQVEMENVASGQVTIAVTGEYLPEGKEIRLDGILL